MTCLRVGIYCGLQIFLFGSSEIFVCNVSVYYNREDTLFSQKLFLLKFIIIYEHVFLECWCVFQ